MKMSLEPLSICILYSNPPIFICKLNEYTLGYKLNVYTAWSCSSNYDILWLCRFILCCFFYFYKWERINLWLWTILLWWFLVNILEVDRSWCWWLLPPTYYSDKWALNWPLQQMRIIEKIMRIVWKSFGILIFIFEWVNYINTNN